MTYATIQPPFTLTFAEMPKKELKRYFEWFMEVIPERLGELTEAVKQTHGFEDWQSNRTPASLDQLGNWFAGQVQTRSRTKEEIEKITTGLLFPIEVSREELTNRTFSLAMDIGMYFSQVLLQNHPSLKWEQRIGSKRFADYGQPLLAGFGPAPLNPVRIAVTLAYGFANKNRSGSRLRELYDVWEKKVRVQS
jgi:hypothetical protein